MTQRTRTTEVCEGMARTVRTHEPRLFRKVMRNHFETAQTALSGAQWRSRASTIEATRQSVDALYASLRAAERSHAYRFGRVNAIFNPTAVLLGDDPTLWTDLDTERGWLE